VNIANIVMIHVNWRTLKIRRDKTHYFVYPEYINANLTRKQGRRVPLADAIENPKLAEIRLAAQKLELDFHIREDAAYTRTWFDPKGLIFIEKKYPKLETIKILSKEIKSVVRPAYEKKLKELAKGSKKKRKSVKTTRPYATSDSKTDKKDFKLKRR